MLKDLHNFRKKVKNLDSTYEWLIILMTIFQASIFQYITWFWNPSDINGYIMTTQLLVFLTLPFLFSIIVWIIGYVYDDIIWSFRLRMFSWGTIYLCIFFNFLILHNYIFVEYTIKTVEMIDFRFFPIIKKTPFIILTITLITILSIIPTYNTHLYNRITIEYKYLNSYKNMVVAPALGIIMPYIIIRIFDYFMFSNILFYTTYAL